MLETDKGCGIPENSYDAIICHSVFAPSHLNTEHIPAILKLIKPRGLLRFGILSEFIVPSTNPKAYFPYDMPRTLKRLEDEGELKIIQCDKRRHYRGLDGSL
eukprot:UN05191